MVDDTNRLLKVFLCHASSDKPLVQKLYSRLISDGVDAWLDKEKLIPGQNWQIEIPKAVKNSDIVIVCLSSQSVNKEGFVQKEIKIALDAADEKPEGEIFIIPARLENCDVPERISQLHWVDLFSDNGYEWLMKALRLRADTVNAIFKSAPNKDNSANLTLEKVNSKVKTSEIITGVFYKKDKDVPYYEVLRFFSNKKVIFSFIHVEDLYVSDLYSSWEEISNWFNQDYTKITGFYHLVGNSLKFSIVSKEGIVYYGGRYLDNKLILNSHSQINDYREMNIKYTRLDGLNIEDD